MCEKTNSGVSKVCTMCGEEKPASLEFFYKNNKGRLNLSSRCKECMKQWKRDNRDKVRASGRRYYEKHKDRIKQYRNENKSAKSEYDKRYRAKNRDRLSEYRSQYYRDNKKRLNDYRKEHYENNKQDYIANSAKRKADKRNQTPDFANLKLIAAIYKNCPEGYHVDHMIPLSMGGLHHESNLCYLPASINMAKGDKYIEEFGEVEFNKHVIYWQHVLTEV